MHEILYCWSQNTELNQKRNYENVLGSSRTGLIFTRSQEGTQPGELTQPGQTEQGIPYHVSSCWVLVGGSRAAGTLSLLWSVRQRQSVRVALCVLLFCVAYSHYQYHCCSSSLCLLSVKLPLSWPTSFCLFISILLLTPAGGEAAAWRFCCQLQPNHNIGSFGFQVAGL